MATLASILQSQASAPTQGVSITAASAVGGPLAWIRYEGDQDSGASLAVAAGGDMAFTTDGTTPDTTVNTTGSIDLSTPGATVDTLGEVGNIINLSANWAFVFLGGLRAGLTDNAILTVTETDLSTAAYKASGFYLYQDGATAIATSLYGVPWAISGFNPANYTKGDDPDLNCQSVCTFVNCLADSNAACRLEFISCSQATDGVAFKIPLTDNTAKEIGNLAAPIFKSSVGRRLVVRVLNDQDAVTYTTRLHAAGYTVNTRGNILPGYSLTNSAG